MKYLLGVDIGTSACKTALFDRDGRTIAQANADYQVSYPHPGWAEQQPECWWAAVCDTIRQITGLIDPGDIAGIGVDGQGWAAVAVDREGRVLCPTPIWMDTRSEECCHDVEKAISADMLFSISGNPLKPSYTLPKILWYKKHLPDVYRNTYKILQSNSFAVYRMTGKLTQDMSQAYGYQCFDMRKGIWDIDALRTVGIRPDMIPELTACHNIVGTVTKEASALTGLLQGTPVVAGGLDAACGSLGAGVYCSGQTQEQGGQAGGMSICINKYCADVRLILGFHVVPGLWLLQGGSVGGGGALKWLKGIISAYSFEEMSAEAEKIPPGSEGLVFLPYMAGERSPLWDANAKGVYFGLDYQKTRGHMVRACMEGTAFALRHNIETAKEAGAEVAEMHAMGGAAGSLVWTQMKSDITGKRILVPTAETATTLGAALLAGVGTGFYADFSDAVNATVRIRRAHDPAGNAAYEKGYQMYRQLYPHLKDLMGGIAQ
jgi:xylulokinase